jgi:HlyD family secretion protein
MKTTGRIAAGLVVAAGAAALAWSLAPAPVPVSVVAAERGPFTDTVEEEGRTRLRDSYTVSAPISGYLQRVELEPGDPVESGQAVARIEPAPVPALDARMAELARDQLAAVQARLETARANLETAGAAARLARSEFERYRELRQRDLVSAAEFDARRSELERQNAAEDAAAHSVEAARFEVAAARALLEIGSGTRGSGQDNALAVRSPVAGVVLRRPRCCEGPITAGDAILEIGDLADLEIQVDLLTMDAVHLQSGMPVRIGGWGGDAVLEGLVRRVDPAGFTRVSALGVDEQRVPVIVDFDDIETAAQRLGVDYRVEVAFVLWQGDAVLQVPTGALFRDDGRWALFVVEDGRARLRRVETGRSAGLRTQILAGLEAGETVINHPGDRVADGVRVAVD